MFQISVEILKIYTKRSNTSYIDHFFPNVSRILWVRPISVHILDCSINAVRIISIIISMNKLADFHIEKFLRHFEIWQKAFVVI